MIEGDFQNTKIKAEFQLIVHLDFVEQAENSTSMDLQKEEWKAKNHRDRFWFFEQYYRKELVWL